MVVRPPRNTRSAPWWSAPAGCRVTAARGAVTKSWGSWGSQLAGVGSYFWHEICAGASGPLVRHMPPAVAPAPEQQTVPKENAEVAEGEHLMVGDLQDPRYLAQYLLDSDVALVRAPYLWHLHESNASLPRRQELENRYFQHQGRGLSCLVSPAELKRWAEGGATRPTAIFAVSHCWESREHPDPCGYQLGLICDYTRRHHQAFDHEMWIFYDYISLCQYKRTALQDLAFRRAMRQMHLLYAHSSTSTLRIESLTPAAMVAKCQAEGREIPVYDEATGELQLVNLEKLRFEDEPQVLGTPLNGNSCPYRQRGWCEAEAQWSAMRGRSKSSIRIDVAEASRSYEVKAPMVPELFRHRVLSANSEAQLKFTWRSDVAQVLSLQEEVFREKAKTCEELLQKGLPDSEFIHLAVALRCFRKLKVLHLRKCQIRDAGANALAKGLQTLSAQKIKIICSDIDGLKFLVKALAEALSSNAAIGQVDLSGLSFSHRPAEKLGDEEVKELSQALQSNETLEELNLASNDIGPEGVKALAFALQRPHRSLVDLNLEGNRMGPEGAEALLEALAINRSITRIGFAGNGLEDRQVEALMNALAQRKARTPNTSHHTFQMSRGLQGGATRKAWTDGSTSLKVIPNIEAMSESLRMNGTSTHLQLKWAIGDTAAQALAASLAINRTVSHIDWAGNRIGDAGAQALAYALQFNRTVLFIDLSGNRIGDAGGQALAACLQQNGSLRQIDLRNNQMSDVAKEALLQLHELQPGQPRMLL